MLDVRGAALGEPDMVRVASEPYRQSIRSACRPGRNAAVTGRVDRFAIAFRSSDRSCKGLRAVCPTARPPGGRSSPRRSRSPIRVTAGEYAPDPSGPHLDFHLTARNHANHDSCGGDASELRKPTGLTAPSPAAGTGRTIRSSAWPAHRRRGEDPVRQSLETIPFRFRALVTACAGMCRAIRVCQWRVAEIS
jgi:hypothetical protein